MVQCHLAPRAQPGRAAGVASAFLGFLFFSVPTEAQVPQGPQKPRAGDPAASPPAVSVPTDVELGLVAGRPRVRPIRLDTPPAIDGRLDDEAWQRAPILTEFVQQSPLDGAPATEQTEVWVAYDSDHIYFAAHVHYEDPSIMRANRVDRDRAFADDLFTVYLDTFMNQQRAYDFDVNPYNVQGDGILNAGGRGSGSQAIPRADRSWDVLFDSGAQIVDDGYTVEMAIPFKSIRYPRRSEGVPHHWGFQIVREIKGKDEENIVWAPMSRDESSFFQQMGVIEGMTDLSVGRNLEILPSFTAIQFGEIDAARPGGPGFVNEDTDPDAGLNLKYGITSNLTLDATINPDFSQIESDLPQIEVNQRFPLFFEELRPFFIEGADIFDISAPLVMVHSRTIVDPDFGAKLTGKVGKLSFGALVADDAGPGRVGDPADPLFERKAQTYVGRTRFDLYSESFIGAIFTDREFMNSYSRLGGSDGILRLDATRILNYNVMGTSRRGLDGVEETGFMWDVRVRQRARNLSWSLLAYQVSPDFETDVGFVRRNDQQIMRGQVGYLFWPESTVINWGPEVRYERNWDFDDVLQDEDLQFTLNFNLANNISFSGDYNRTLERFGGIDFDKNRFSVRANVNSSRRFSFGGSAQVGDEIRFDDDPFLGDAVRWNVFSTLRPIPRLTSNVRIQTSRLTDPRNGNQEVFDVKILRAQTTLQLTDRLSLRNISEFNTFDETLDLNILFTYRVNAGTVFYVGYDDHYRQADLIGGDIDGDGLNEQLFFESDLRRTSRALFTKFRYLFRM